MFRRKEKVVECRSFEQAAAHLLENDARGHRSSLHFLAQELVRGNLPTAACLKGVVESCLPSEDAQIRELAFRIFKYVYKLGHNLQHWATVRRAIWSEISNAESSESALPFEAAFDLLLSLSLPQQVLWLCCADSSAATKASFEVEDCRMRAVAVRCVGQLLVRVWSHVESSAHGVDALLHDTVPRSGGDGGGKYTLTSDEPRRIKENLADLLKDCYKACMLGILGKATTLDTGTGNLRLLPDSPLVFDAYCFSVLQLLLRHNENRKGLSLDIWLDAITGSTNRDDGSDIDDLGAAGDPLGLQSALLAQARSSRFSPFVQAVLHDCVRNLGLLLAKEEQYQLASGGSMGCVGLVHQVYLALLHEHLCAGSESISGGGGGLNVLKVVTPTPIVETITKEAFSFGDVDADADTGAGIAGAGKTTNPQFLLQMTQEWVQGPLLAQLRAWRSTPQLGVSSYAEYVFGRSTGSSSWGAAHRMTELLQFPLLQALRPHLCADIVACLIPMMDVEVSLFAAMVQEQTHECRERGVRDLHRAFALLLLVQRWGRGRERGRPAGENERLDALQRTLQLLKATYVLSGSGGVATCRLLTELNAVCLNLITMTDSDEGGAAAHGSREASEGTRGVRGGGNISQWLSRDSVRRLLPDPGTGFQGLAPLSRTDALSARFCGLYLVGLLRTTEMAVRHQLLFSSGGGRGDEFSMGSLYSSSFSAGATSSMAVGDTRWCRRTLRVLDNALQVIESSCGCLFWFVDMSGGEAAQLAWADLSAAMMHALLPVDFDAADACSGQAGSTSRCLSTLLRSTSSQGSGIRPQEETEASAGAADKLARLRDHGRALSSSLIVLLESTVGALCAGSASASTRPTFADNAHPTGATKQYLSCACRSRLLQLLSRSVGVMSLHALGGGPWGEEIGATTHSNAASSHDALSSTVRGAEREIGRDGEAWQVVGGDERDAWSTHTLAPLNVELFARGESLLRQLQKDLAENRDHGRVGGVGSPRPLRGGMAGTSSGGVGEASSGALARQFSNVEAIVTIARVSLTAHLPKIPTSIGPHSAREQDAALPTLCLEVLRGELHGEQPTALREFLNTQLQLLTRLLADGGEGSVRGPMVVGGEAGGSNHVDIVPGRGHGWLRDDPWDWENRHSVALVHAGSDYAVPCVGGFNYWDGEAAAAFLPYAPADLIYASDDVLAAHFPTAGGAPASQTLQLPPGLTASAHAVDSVVYSQISGSADPITVLAAVTQLAHGDASAAKAAECTGNVYVRTINSSGFKLDGYVVQVLLRGGSWLHEIRDVSRMTKSTIGREEGERGVVEGGDEGGLASHLPDEYLLLERRLGNGYERRQFSASTSPGIPQQSCRMEYIVNNGTADVCFPFRMGRAAPVEVVVRLLYFDLQEGTPVQDLWSLLNTPRKSGATIDAKSRPEVDEVKTGGAAGLGQSGGDDFHFTVDKPYFSHSSSTQCAPLRMCISAQLRPYGRGMFSCFSEASWLNRLQLWCHPRSEDQLLRPEQGQGQQQKLATSTPQLRGGSGAGIPRAVFCALWSRLGLCASKLIPLRATCHGTDACGGAPMTSQFGSTFSVVASIDAAVQAMEQGASGGVLPGLHYIGMQARAQLGELYGDIASQDTFAATETAGWALQSLWGEDVAIRLCVHYSADRGTASSEEGAELADRFDGDAQGAGGGADPLKLVAIGPSSVHASELASASAAAVGLTAARKSAEHGLYRCDLELRASSLSLLSVLLGDLDALVAALTADTLEVNEEEYLEKFSELRSGSVAMPKLAVARPLSSAVGDRVSVGMTSHRAALEAMQAQTGGPAGGAFGLY